MTIHPKLEPFDSIKHIKLFNKLLSFIQDDLKAVDVVDVDVDVWEKERPRNVLKRMFTLEEATEPTQIMFVSGEYQTRPFLLAVPLQSAFKMPYHLEMDLPVQVDFVACYVTALIGKKWEVDGGPDGVKDRLKEFEMPKIAWQQAEGAYSFHVKTGAVIAPSEEDPTHTVWSVQSGYHGSVLKKGPRCSPYFEAIKSLETVLSNL